MCKWYLGASHGHVGLRESPLTQGLSLGSTKRTHAWELNRLQINAGASRGKASEGSRAPWAFRSRN